MINYLLSDCLCRINNGQKVFLTSVDVKYSSFCLKILILLYNEGYISGFSILSMKSIRVFLKYNQKGAIGFFKVISCPSKREYVNLKKLNSLSFCFISTSKGILPVNLAKFFKIGGELLFKIEFY